MSTTFDDAVIRFLSEKENFKIALEVADRINAVKTHLLISFWDKLTKKIKDELVEDIGTGKGWLLKLDEQMGGKYSGITLIPLISANIVKPRFTFRLEREENFYHGVYATNGDGKLDNLRSVFESSTLWTELSEMRFKHDDRWLGWRYSDRIYDNNRIYIELAENSDDLCDRILSTFVHDFNTLKSDIIDFNLAAVGTTPGI